MTFRALGRKSAVHKRETRYGWGRDLPLLALIQHFIAEVEDDLPVLAGQSLICRFHFFSWRRE
jgi:hypothetical protein